MSLERPMIEGLDGVRVAVVQPLLPKYRVPFFDLLARRTGVRLTVLCDMKPRGSLQSMSPTEAFEAEHWPARDIGPFHSHPAIWHAVTATKFDVAVLGWNLRYLQLVPGLLRARLGRRPTLLWGHGFSRAEHRVKRAVRDAVIGLTDGMILYGHATRRRLAAAGVCESKLFVAQNAIDQSAIEQAIRSWRSEPGRLEAWQRQEGLRDGEVVAFVSRVEPDKRVEFLLEAFARLAARMPDVTLAIIGGGSRLDAAKTMARSLGLAERVRFTGPIYQEEQLAPWLLTAGCFAYPEAIGLSIYHGFGYGLPVVTSDDIASHNPEIESLEPGVNGILYAHRDVEAFASAVGRVIADAASRDLWRRGAIDTVHRPGGFNLETMVQGYAEALRSAVAGRRGFVGEPGRSA